MKVSNLTNSLLISLLFSVTAVEADSKYPATDFQPRVVYHDLNYKHSGSSASSSASTTLNREASLADSKYPAANFQPEVLFQDKSYKHSKGSAPKATELSTVESSKNIQEGTLSKESSKNTQDGTSSKESSKNIQEGTPSKESSENIQEGKHSNMLLGLMLIVIAGFLFYKKGSQSQPASTESPKRKATKHQVVASNNADGVSGVARYLESKAGSLVSGVGRYLEGRENVVASGVAKYLAKQKVSARVVAAESASGVEKYLRDQG